MTSKAIIILLSFLAGTFWGSFFFTLALRYASGDITHTPLKALFSRSQCPSCKTHISPFFLIPVIGFLLLRGRCRSCGTRISMLYPLTELLYGVIAALFAWKFGITPYSVIVYLLSAIAVCIAVVDLKTLTIPNSLVIAFAVLSAYPIVLNYNILDNLYGLAALFAIFLVILLVFPGSFGGGDVKFASAIGLLSGFELSIVVLEISLISGAVSGVIYAIMTKKSLRSQIPFAPFLTAGLIFSLLYGREILLLYYRMIY